MKKLSYIFMGMLLGIALAVSASAYADDLKSLIGLKVGSVWELRVDGETVGQVPIIKGSSYGPIRQIAEIAGLDVDFEPGVVLLETIIDDEVNVIIEKPKVRGINEVQADLDSIIRSIESVGDRVKSLAVAASDDVQRDLPSEEAQFWAKEYNQAVKLLAELEDHKVELEAELAALE